MLAEQQTTANNNYHKTFARDRPQLIKVTLPCERTKLADWQCDALMDG